MTASEAAAKPLVDERSAMPTITGTSATTLEEAAAEETAVAPKEVPTEEAATIAIESGSKAEALPESSEADTGSRIEPSTASAKQVVVTETAAGTKRVVKKAPTPTSGTGTPPPTTKEGDGPSSRSSTGKKKRPKLRLDVAQAVRPFDPGFGDNRPLPARAKRGWWSERTEKLPPPSRFLGREEAMSLFENATGAALSKSRSAHKKAKEPAGTDRSVYSSLSMFGSGRPSSRATGTGTSPYRRAGGSSVRNWVEAVKETVETAAETVVASLSTAAKSKARTRAKSPPRSREAIRGAAEEPVRGRNYVAPRPLPKKLTAGPSYEIRVDAAYVHAHGQGEADTAPLLKKPPLRCFGCFRFPASCGCGCCDCSCCGTCCCGCFGAVYRSFKRCCRCCFW
jgi:hypothetical protein